MEKGQWSFFAELKLIDFLFFTHYISCMQPHKMQLFHTVQQVTFVRSFAELFIPNFLNDYDRKT